MTLADGLIDVAPGKIAAVVTHLRMLAPSPPRPAREPGDLVLRRVEQPSTGWYRDLYARVGADWLWFSRLRLDPRALAAILADQRVEVYALTSAERDEGLLELDFRADGLCELAFLGVAPGLVGQGTGRLLMNHAIACAWARPIGCLWVHTSSLDHPSALGFYIRSGFRPFKRQIEIADDPRLTGDLPPGAAPNVPIIGAE
jgi:GNAT superfamily N-acetyltransferase